jgi:hypothetical protein
VSEYYMKFGRWYVSTGFRRFGADWWHLLFALHQRWRVAFVKPASKPDYRRLYLGPLEIEWSHITAQSDRVVMGCMNKLDLKAITVAFLVANLLGKSIWWVASHVYHGMFPL